jgi:NADH-quinone oxidoreductase subunit G
MLAQPRRAYLLMGLEPSLDCGDPVAARAALKQAQSVVALTAWRSPELLELADCLLPITPFAETGGAFVNCEGRLQAFNGVARPQGQARPGWKVLRVIGNTLNLPDFGYDSVDAVRQRALQAFLSPDRAAADTDGRHFEARLSNRAGGAGMPSPLEGGAVLQRVADVPIYFADPLVRRARSLQLTSDARPPVARFSAATLADLGLADGDSVRLSQPGGEAVLVARRDDRVAPGVVQVSAAHPATANLPMMFGPITAEKAVAAADDAADEKALTGLPA